MKKKRKSFAVMPPRRGRAADGRERDHAGRRASRAGDSRWGSGLGGVDVGREQPDSEEARDEEDRRQLLLHDDRDRAGNDGEEPREHLLPERLPPQVPAGFQDERHHHWRDAVEEPAELPCGGEADVCPRGGGHEEERREAECDGDRKPSGDAMPHVSAVDAELVRERPGARCRNREPVLVFLLAQPASFLGEVPAHGVRESDRPAETERAEAEEVESHLGERRPSRHPGLCGTVGLGARHDPLSVLRS